MAIDWNTTFADTVVGYLWNNYMFGGG